MLGRFDWDDRRWLTGSEELEQGHRRDGRGVGGGTIHFGSVALRLWPEDFTRLSRDGVGADWPIRYTELEPYYDRVEAELALSGPEQMPWGPHQYAYPQPPHRLTARDLLIGGHGPAGDSLDPECAGHPDGSTRGPLAMHELRVLPVGLQEPCQGFDACHLRSEGGAGWRRDPH